MPATHYASDTGSAVTGVSINNTRQLFAFGNLIHKLEPSQDFFFRFLSQMRKTSVNARVWKFLEERPQWHRRGGEIQAAKTSISIADPTNVSDLRFQTFVTNKGVVGTSDLAPLWTLADQILQVACEINDGAGGAYLPHRANVRVTVKNAGAATYSSLDIRIRAIDGDTAYATTYSGKTLRFNDGGAYKLVSSSFAEATGAPQGWTDKLGDREFYTQIFKTSIPTVSGSSMAEVFRGHPSEFARIWRPKMMEHRHEIGSAVLFNVGGYAAEDGTEPQRFTWGALPYTEVNGTVQTFSYGSTKYDDFMTFISTFMDPAKGGSQVKLGICSRDVKLWMSKLGDNGFLNNSVGPAAYNISVMNVPNQFGGPEITVVRTPFGRIGFVEDSNMSGPFANYAHLADPRYVRIRPLAGNGISRDTFVKPNVQNNDTDGRKDMILTELGFEEALPELHATIKFQ